MEQELRRMLDNTLEKVMSDPDFPGMSASKEAWREYYRKKTEEIPLVENPDLDEAVEKKELRLLCGDCKGYYRIFVNAVPGHYFPAGIPSAIDKLPCLCPHCAAPISHWISLAAHSAGWFNASIGRTLEEIDE